MELAAARASAVTTIDAIRTTNGLLPALTESSLVTPVNFRQTPPTSPQSLYQTQAIAIPTTTAATTAGPPMLSSTGSPCSTTTPST
jgi:hypothetical protein